MMKLSKLSFLVLSIFLLSVHTAAAQDSELTDGSGPLAENTILKNIVVIRALDKITARITEIEARVGEEVQFGTLALTAKYCRTRPPIEPPETFAYLEINDVMHSGEKKRVFSGWMVASSPALNALEHPVYDVWVINCKMSEPDAVSLSEK